MNILLILMVLISICIVLVIINFFREVMRHGYQPEGDGKVGTPPQGGSGVPRILYEVPIDSSPRPPVFEGFDRPERYRAMDPVEFTRPRGDNIFLKDGKKVGVKLPKPTKPQPGTCKTQYLTPEAIQKFDELDLEGKCIYIIVGEFIVICSSLVVNGDYRPPPIPTPSDSERQRDLHRMMLHISSI